MSYLKQSFLVLMGLLLMTCAAWAQTNDRGNITGIVTDPSGAVVPDVALAITNVGTGVTNNVATNTAGVYTVPNLPPAVYRLSAEKAGFKKYVRTSLLVQIGATTRLDFALTLGAKTEVVEVTSTAPLLQRDSAETSTQVSARQVEDLPMLGNGEARTAATFMQLAPGVTGKGTSQGGAGGNRTMSTAVSGSMVSSTTIALDGADVPTQNEFEGDLRGLQIPPDAIGEFKLQATNASAEYGRSGGGTAIFEVRSGTNQIHGTGYEYLRNTVLNAVPWMANATNTACNGHACNPPYKQNEWGATAGGAIKKDKAFIFGYYDGFKLVTSGGGGVGTVPSLRMREGNLTDYPNPLYDPSLAVQAAANGAPLCGPMICDTRSWVPNAAKPGSLMLADTSGTATVNSAYFDRVSKLVIPLMPTPNVGSPNAIDHNWTSFTSNPQSLYEYGFKGDYVFNEKSRINVYYGVGQYSTPNNAPYNGPLYGGNQPSINYTRNVRLNWNMTPKSNITNQLTLALNEWNSGQQPPGTWMGKSDWVSYLGIQGVAPNLKTEWPQIVINGASWDGGGGSGKNNQHTSILNDSITWIKGRHTAKFGFQYMKGASNNLGTGRSAGYFNFLNQQTGLGADIPGVVNAGSTGIAFASFLLGYANEVQVDHIYAPSYPRNAYWAMYAQDDFKVSKKLTLNLGVRYDLFNPDYQLRNTKAWIDYSVPNPGAPGYLGALVTASPANNSGLITYKTNISPRIGLAYALNDKTVIRAAYGIFYAQGNENRLDRGGFIQGYNGATGITSGGLAPGFIWGNPTSQMLAHLAFTPSQSPTQFNGGGTPKHSAGSLIAQDKTDSLPPYMNTFNFGVQRMLPGQMTLTVTYVGNVGIHISSRVTPWDKMPDKYLQYGFTNTTVGTTVTPLLLAPVGNADVQLTAPIASMPIDPATGNHSPFPGYEQVLGGAATMGQALKTSPQFQGTHRYYEGVGNSNYNALQVKLEKHFSNGLSLLVSYAWSKTLTDGGSIFSTFSSDFGTDTPWNARLQKTYSFADLPNLASISYVYDLPVGKGKHFLNHGGVANAILGGWKYSGVLQYQSGMPQEVEVGGRTGLNNQGWGRANQVPGVSMNTGVKNSQYNPFQNNGPGQPQGTRQLNPAAFSIPSLFAYGTITPNEATVRTYYWPNEDMSLLKEWQLHESWGLTFRADFFNIFNRHIFGENGGAYAAANDYVGNPGFGQFGGTINSPRIIQFGLKLKW